MSHQVEVFSFTPRKLFPSTTKKPKQIQIKNLRYFLTNYCVNVSLNCGYPHYSYRQLELCKHNKTL